MGFLAKVPRLWTALSCSEVITAVLAIMLIYKKQVSRQKIF